MLNNGVTANTPREIPFGPGVYFDGVDYNEAVAPTEEAVKAGIIGATQEGGKVVITPEYFDIPVDGVDVLMEELKHKIGEKASIEASFLELKPEFVRKQVIGKLGETTDKNFDVITSDAYLRPSHFYNGCGYWGHLTDGREFIVIFKKALWTSGYEGENKAKTNSVLKGTFECHTDAEYVAEHGASKLPYAMFIRKAEGWTAVNADEAAAAA